MDNFPRMHVSYYVSDLDKTIQFYDAFFGQPAAKREGTYAKYILEQPALVISFIENTKNVKAQFGHLGLQLKTLEELHERLAAMKDKNLAIREEMGVSCCYALQDKFWVSDPDGYQWELYYFHKDVAFNDPHYELKGDGKSQQQQQEEALLVAEKKVASLTSACCS